MRSARVVGYPKVRIYNLNIIKFVPQGDMVSKLCLYAMDARFIIIITCRESDHSLARNLVSHDPPCVELEHVFCRLARANSSKNIEHTSNLLFIVMRRGEDSYSCQQKWSLVREHSSAAEVAVRSIPGPAHQYSRALVSISHGLLLAFCRRDTTNK